MLCHRCQDSDFLLTDQDGNCYTCNGARELSQEHENLFHLAFAEEVNIGGDYSMYLQKVLNHLETISVTVVREDGEFKFLR